MNWAVQIILNYLHAVLLFYNRSVWVAAQNVAIRPRPVTKSPQPKMAVAKDVSPISRKSIYYQSKTCQPLSTICQHLREIVSESAVTFRALI